MEKGSEVAPHQCPQCGGAAYVGAFDLQCTTITCDHYHAETAAAHGRERFPSASTLLDDESTEPQGYSVAIGGVPLKGVPSGSFGIPTEAELVKAMRDAVAEAKGDPKCTPEDAAELDRWLDEMLRAYLVPLAQKSLAAFTGIPTEIAAGEDLDKWARIWACDRRPGETDAELRKRVKGASLFSPGASL